LPFQRWRRLLEIKGVIQDADKFEAARGGLYWSNIEVGDMLTYWTKDFTQPIDILRLAASADSPALRVVDNPIQHQISDGGWAAEHGLTIPGAKAAPVPASPAYESYDLPVAEAPAPTTAPAQEWSVYTAAVEYANQKTRANRRPMEADPAPGLIPEEGLKWTPPYALLPLSLPADG